MRLTVTSDVRTVIPNPGLLVLLSSTLVSWSGVSPYSLRKKHVNKYDTGNQMNVILNATVVSNVPVPVSTNSNSSEPPHTEHSVTLQTERTISLN